MILLVVWSMVVAAVSWLCLRRIYSRFSSCGVKHFTPVPVLGNMTRVLFRLDHFVDSSTKLYRYFPNERFVGHYEFLNAVVQIRDLNLIKKITIKDFEYFLDHKVLTHEEVDPYIGNSLFSLRGQKWKEMRSILSPAFTSSKIRSMVPYMVEIGEEMVKTIKQKINTSGKSGVEVDTKDLLTRFTNDVIAFCIFGLEINSQTDPNNKFYDMGKVASTFSLKQIIKLFGYSNFPSIMKILNIELFPDDSKIFFKFLVMNTIRTRKTHKICRNDFIHLLMEAKKVWTDDELIAQGVLFFMAGFETVSITMVFLLYELAVNLDVQNKLFQEIKEDWEMNDRKITLQSLQRLSYMDMVISEALRLWPPNVTTDRMCTIDYNLGKSNQNATQDYIVRKGEAVSIPIWAIHRSPEYFPNPDKFDPERFSEQNKHNIKPFTYMPFGLGPRKCIGSRFVLCEIKVALYLLLLNMELYPGIATSIPATLTKNSFSLRLEGGYCLRFCNRN